jgi:anti-sigma regulatory factor (Ser/Thr protein kinase)
MREVRRRFPFLPSSASSARHDLSSWFVDGGSPDEAGLYSAALVLSELVTNAVLHAAPLPGDEIEVRWGLTGGDLEIHVTDGGGVQRPRLVDAGWLAVRGRGLSIVDALAVAWWVSEAGPRRTVHARLSVDWAPSLPAQETPSE